MGMEIKVNGVRIKQPLNPQLSLYNLTKAGRVANGKLTLELVAKKKKLFLDYQILSGKDLDQILNIIDNNLFFNVSYENNGRVESFRAYVGEINRTLQRGGGLNGWYWSNVTFNFIEQ